MSDENMPGQYQIFAVNHRCSCVRKRKKGQSKHTKACARKRQQQGARQAPMHRMEHR